MLEFGAQDADWLLLNPGRTGYYRVVYDDVMMRRIGQALYKNATVNITKSRFCFYNYTIYSYTLSIAFPLSHI